MSQEDLFLFYGQCDAIRAANVLDMNDAFALALAPSTSEGRRQVMISLVTRTYQYDPDPDRFGIELEDASRRR